MDYSEVVGNRTFLFLFSPGANRHHDIISTVNISASLPASTPVSVTFQTSSLIFSSTTVRPPHYRVISRVYIRSARLVVSEFTLDDSLPDRSARRSGVRLHYTTVGQTDRPDNAISVKQPSLLQRMQIYCSVGLCQLTIDINY